MKILLYLLYLFVRLVLPLRYRIRVHGYKECVAKGRNGVLFLPNHPALIDPIIINAILYRKFHPRSLVDEKQIRTTILKYLQKACASSLLPDIGIAGRPGMRRSSSKSTSAPTPQAGRQPVALPAGRIYRSRFEKLRGNGGVARILEAYPEVRIVLVRTRGLWGSSFGRGKGYQTPFPETLLSNVKCVLANGIFFCPRRDVSVEFFELPEDFPRTADKEVINRWLENFYNEDAPPNTYVPYYWWERGGPRRIPEPETTSSPIDTKDARGSPPRRL